MIISIFKIFAGPPFVCCFCGLSVKATFSLLSKFWLRHSFFLEKYFWVFLIAKVLCFLQMIYCICFCLVLWGGKGYGISLIYLMMRLSWMIQAMWFKTANPFEGQLVIMTFQVVTWLLDPTPGSSSKAIFFVVSWKWTLPSRFTSASHLHWGYSSLWSQLYNGVPLIRTTIWRALSFVFSLKYYEGVWKYKLNLPRFEKCF